MISLQGKKLSSKHLGCVAELVSGDVAEGAGQQRWNFKTGIGYIDHTVENWINDGAGYAALAAITGVPSFQAAIPKLYAGQGFIHWVAADFAGNQNYCKFGDNGLPPNSATIKASRNAAGITDVDGNAFELGNFTTTVTGVKAMIAIVYDPSKETADEQLVGYLYDAAGAQLEDPNITGVKDTLFELGGEISFNETVEIIPLFTEVAGFGIASAGLVFFDELPDDLIAGLESMSANPADGCFDAWRSL